MGHLQYLLLHTAILLLYTIIYFAVYVCTHRVVMYMYIHIYTHVHVHVYAYTYTYIHQ